MNRRHFPHPIEFVVTLLLFGLWAGCGDELTSDDAGDRTNRHPGLIVGNVSVDFMTGSLGVVDTETLAAEGNLGSIHSDHAIRYDHGFLFVLNRLGADNIQRLDPDTLVTLWQYSTGAGSNPYDIALVDSQKAYVPLYEMTSLLIVNPSAVDETQFVRGTIDLAPFADQDGIPEANAVAVVGDLAFVTLQRLDRNNYFQPTGDSRLIAIDTETDELIPLSGDSNHLVLPFANPVSMRVWRDQLWIGCVGFYGVQDGAIVPFDTTSLNFLPPMLLESELGGDLAGFTATHPLYVIFNDSSFAGTISEVDTQADTIRSILNSVTTSWDIETDGEYIYIADRDVSMPGIRVFFRSDLTEVTEQPIQTGLPPWDLQLIDTAYPTAQ